jgi:hypothetical protein
VSVALGKKILGILLAIAGVNVVFQGHALSEPGGVADLVTGAVMFAAGIAIFLWGFRRYKP